jgi:hypothetical protein
MASKSKRFLGGPKMKIFSFILRNRWLFILLLLFSVLIAGIRAWNAYYTNLGIESGFFDNFYSALQTPIANANFPIEKQPRAQMSYCQMLWNKRNRAYPPASS